VLFVIVAETNIKKQSVLGTQLEPSLSNNHSIDAVTASELGAKDAVTSVQLNAILVITLRTSVSSIPSAAVDWMDVGLAASFQGL